jgi:hypothetical protein
VKRRTSRAERHARAKCRSFRWGRDGSKRCPTGLAEWSTPGRKRAGPDQSDREQKSDNAERSHDEQSTKLKVSEDQKMADRESVKWSSEETPLLSSRLPLIMVGRTPHKGGSRLACSQRQRVTLYHQLSWANQPIGDGMELLRCLILSLEVAGRGRWAFRCAGVGSCRACRSCQIRRLTSEKANHVCLRFRWRKAIEFHEGSPGTWRPCWSSFRGVDPQP